jgi:HD superfamily phosphohydrolase
MSSSPEPTPTLPVDTLFDDGLPKRDATAVALRGGGAPRPSAADVPIAPPLQEVPLTALNALPDGELFVPVTGLVRLTPQELAVIDHPAFQRLREINQLGAALLVFPGATHKRFEHCVGTLERATQMMDAIDRNNELRVRKALTDSSRTTWPPSPPFAPPLPPETRPGQVIAQHERVLTRLAALLHDIGHLPYGHTFEDELGLLSVHDADDRLNHIFNQTVWRGKECPSLRSLVDEQFKAAADAVRDLETQDQDFAQAVREAVLPEKYDYSATELVLDLISKSRPGRLSSRYFRRHVLRNIIGNTYCADLLDYLYRDWHHVGKPRHFDSRLLEYLEIRESRRRESAEDRHWRLVLNLRTEGRLRTDAVTGILDLLDSRYQLAEIVLFHRVKLDATAMIERVISELVKHHRHASAEEDYFSGKLDALLECDDNEVIEMLRRDVEDVLASESPLADDVRRTFEGMRDLLWRLRERDLHKMVLAIRPDECAGHDGVMAEFSGDARKARTAPDKSASAAAERRRFLAEILEKEFDLSPGDVAVYCPRRRMNAKVARVEILYNHEVKELATWEDEVGRAQWVKPFTGGHLKAQTTRFAQLWHFHVCLSRGAIAALKSANRLGLFKRFVKDWVLGSVEEDVELALRLAQEFILSDPALSESHEARELVGARGAAPSDVYPGGTKRLITAFVTAKTQASD